MPGFPLFLSFTISHSLLKLMSIESVMPSNYLIPCCPLLLLPSIFPSISSSNEYLGLISFKIDWFDLLSVQGTLKSLLQHHSSKTSILQCSGHYGPTLTSVHVYWKMYNFYCADIFQQSDFRI